MFYISHTDAKPGDFIARVDTLETARAIARDWKADGRGDHIVWTAETLYNTASEPAETFPAFIVTCDHVAPKWRLDRARFSIDPRDPDWQGKVRGDERAYHASCRSFGCSKSFATRRDAITSLLFDNGCTDIRIEYQA